MIITILTVATVLISLYVFAESLLAIAKLPGGFIHCCCKVKYVLALSSSLAFIWYANNGFMESRILAFGSAGTIAWFIWPRTVYRFHTWLDEIKYMEERL